MPHQLPTKFSTPLTFATALSQQMGGGLRGDFPDFKSAIDGFVFLLEAE